MFEYTYEHLNDFEKYAELKRMKPKDKQKYVENSGAYIKLLKLINNGAQDIYESRDSLKDVFKDKKINRAIAHESACLRRYNTINSCKDFSVPTKINCLSKILQKLQQAGQEFSKAKEALEEYINKASSKPGEEPILFNNVLKVFNDDYNEQKKKQIRLY